MVMSFHMKLSEPGLLKDSISIISDIIDEGNFQVDKNGISLLAPDRTMVSVVDFKILSSAFDDYKADSETTLGLNLANLNAILRRAKKSDQLSLKSGDGKLVIKFEGNGTRKFEIPLIDVKTEEPPISQLKFNTKLELETDVIKKGIADAEVIGDSVFLEAEGDKFKMFAKGDVSSAEMEIKKGDEGLLSIETNEKIQSQYPLDYLKKMIKASKLADQVVLEFGEDYPMRLDFKQVDKLQLKFILAPRISEE